MGARNVRAHNGGPQYGGRQFVMPRILDLAGRTLAQGPQWGPTMRRPTIWGPTISHATDLGPRWEDASLGFTIGAHSVGAHHMWAHSFACHGFWTSLGGH